jgi:hypothetical protein
MNWFLILLAVTIFVRGMGAGIIYDVAVVSLSLRHDIGVVSYAHYARALFKRGFRTFFTVSVVGAVLTIVVAVGSFLWSSAGVRSWTCVALGMTILAFAATARALPAVLKLRRLPDEPKELDPVLAQFAIWHRVSALWQVASFVALVVALCVSPR